MRLGCLRLLGLFVGLFLLMACQPLLQQELDEYASRLGNIIQQRPPTFESPPPLSLPAKQSYQAAEASIKLSEFYALRHCRLYSLVAERNTALGKLQGLSQRYIYEQKLLSAIQECLMNTSDPDLITRLSKWQAAKYQGVIPLWSALLDDNELRSSLAGTRQQQMPETALLDSSRAALDYLISIAPQSNSIQSEQLEQYLQVLHQGQLPARWFQTRRILTAYLQTLTPWLESQPISCRPPETSEYLRNVFALFFIEKIQPIAGQLAHYQYELAPRLHQLYAHGPKSMQDWLAERDAEQQAFALALQSHVNWWQALFKQCKLSLPSHRHTP
ncbi:DUF3080 family protein [Bowmanella sp. Y26]|uniref:DUF3080 family protein n=1 Tax=Bowmanella yangjiangensis TaxID=2811230 RepID=UPI001BDCBAB5|nr:DUF3080 family protein [Bowmanella yangjiangensis]MBT1063797.1 DUF3080 family protein [Bowmanella yangjiangensis]